MTTILTQTVARLLFLPIMMVALATLIKGYGDTGDGFTAGVIAGLGMLIQFLAFGEAAMERVLPIHHAFGVAFGGLVLALAVTFVPVVLGDPILTHAPEPFASVIHIGRIELITAVVFDIGVFLLVFGFVVSALGMIGRVEPRSQT